MTRAGLTLAEMLVTLVLLGIVMAVAGLALRRIDDDASDDSRAGLLQARRQAIATGAPVTGWMSATGRFTAHPDGTVVTDSAPSQRLTMHPYAR